MPPTPACRSTVARAIVWASCQPCQIPRADLLALIGCAGLAGSVLEAEVAAMPDGPVVLDRETVLALIEMAGGDVLRG